MGEPLGVFVWRLTPEEREIPPGDWMRYSERKRPDAVWGALILGGYSENYAYGYGKTAEWAIGTAASVAGVKPEALWHHPDCECPACRPAAGGE